MSDDFGTVNVRRGDRARELEVLRQHYRGHRDALSRLVADAPTEQLAGEYQRLITNIDEALRKLDELEGRPTTQPGTRPLPPTTSAGMRPLGPSTPTPPPAEPVTEPQRYVEEPPPATNNGGRTLLIVVVGVLVLAAIAYLIWRASRDRSPTTATTTGTVIEQPVTPATADTAPPAVTTAVASVLKVTPALADYGVVRKGTRAVRQFEATNSGAAPLDIQVARSACRCLFYAFHSPIPPHGKETITVTVDGAKAKAGPIEEQLAVTSKKDPSVAGTITIRAVVK